MVKEAIAINEKNKNTLWQDAKEKEMENVKVTIQSIPDGEWPPNYQYVNCNIVLEIQMEDLQRKACHMVVGYVTYTTDVVI